MGRIVLGLAVLGLALLGLGGCAFPGPSSPQDRDVLASCRAEADRVYNAQNRYQLSERDSRDTPFSGSGQPTSPSDGLADQYTHERRVDDCVRHGDAGESVPSPNSPPALAPAPASAMAHTP